MNKQVNTFLYVILVLIVLVTGVIVIQRGMPETDPIIVGAITRSLSYDNAYPSPSINITPSYDSPIARSYTNLIGAVTTAGALPYVSMMRIPARRDADVINAKALQHQEQLFIEEELTCLATNIYHESRGEGIIGMAAVAWVTINRQRSEQFPDTICGVVYDPNQFSWVYEGKTTSGNNAAYRVALAVATTIYDGQDTLTDITLGSLYFHSGPASAVSWTKRFDMVFEYGGHKFYRDNR